MHTLEAIERRTIERRVRRHGGNRTQAAKSLGISVRTLQRKLKGYSLRQLFRSEPTQPPV